MSVRPLDVSVRSLPRNARVWVLRDGRAHLYPAFLVADIPNELYVEDGDVRPDRAATAGAPPVGWGANLRDRSDPGVLPYSGTARNAQITADEFRKRHGIVVDTIDRGP